jgi:hypothetical protein
MTWWQWIVLLAIFEALSIGNFFVLDAYLTRRATEEVGEYDDDEETQ